MPSPDPHSAPDASALGARLLLVDDEPELRRVFRRILERAGYLVVEASNGRAALELARHVPFDVVVSDICMPVMTGLELLDLLSVEAPGLPVMFVSGSSGLMDLETARGCGAFDFLQKPVDFCELRARVALALTESRRLRERGMAVGTPCLPGGAGYPT